MEYYDTIIIGAGLAGCTLANMLFNQNKSILILEKQNLKNKNKLCGGIVTSKAYKLLFKIYGDKLKEIEFKKFDSFQVSNKGVIKEVKKQNIYTVYRKDLDDFVVNEFLKKGGKILDNTNYDKIDFKNKIIYVSNRAFKYNNLVGADGVFSRVREDLTNRKQKMNLAIEQEISLKKEIIQIDFLDYFKGYAWTVFNNNTSLIGLGDVSQKRDIKENFLRHFELLDDSSVRGAFLPTGSDMFLKKGKVFFIGDAAGLASPVIGEGIYYALSSAYNLARTMSNFYKIRMMKDRFIIFSHKISKLLIYNTYIRNFFYKFYGKSKIITFLIDIVLRTLIN